ncbi:kinase-like domain-containing protein [Crassisporium funariophilum]|nr:kinase-like domain-containing protein [Crassisporium funariophilum]
MMLKPLGPRSKSTSTRSAPPPSLSISSSLSGTAAPHNTAANGPNNATLQSPSDTPRYNTPIPTLGTPVPNRNRPSGLPKIKLDFNPGLFGGAPFQHVGGPSESELMMEAGSTVSPEERTIKPHSTISPEAPHVSYNGHGLSMSKSNSSSGADQMDGLRKAVGKMSIGSCAPNTSRNGTGPSDHSVNSTSVASSNFPSTPHAKEFSDETLEELSRLGEGAGGAVHKVRDTRSGLVYARKTITTREVAVKQVLRELSIISSTHHVNIVQCHGAYMSPSSSEVKIMMEYCEGGSLEAVGTKIKERGAVVGEKIAGRLAEGVLQGLAYLHTKKTIHRDIKPSNILLSREGIVKLCDFGVSGELVDSIVGTFTGTLFYMAPERISGGDYTVRSDVWSTGISILELVQNRFPFPNLPPIELIMHITTLAPPRLEDEPGVTWSDEMKDFIKQTLILDAKSRPTPKEMLAHPWISTVMKQEVHMGRWIRQVWGWPKHRRSKDSNSQSRPSTAGGDNSPESVNGSEIASGEPEYFQNVRRVEGRGPSA